MNKKLLAIAVGAAFGATPMFASAAVTVYGHAQVEVGTVDDGSSDATVVEDNARGRIGVKASEKLGNGMTAIAKYEFKTDTTDNNSTKSNAESASLTAREAFVGLKGGFGTVQLGNLKSAYKYSGGVKYDPFTATLLEARGNGGMSKGELGDSAFGHNSFVSNSIGYMTPKIGGGFTGWATFNLDEAGDKKGSDGDYSFGLKYAQKAWEVFVAGINNDDAAGGDGVKFGGQFKFSNFKVSGQFEQLSPAGGADIDVYFLGGQAKFGNNVLVAQFGNTDSGTSDTDYWTIGLIHNLSKKSRLTAGFRNTDDGSSEEDVFAVGMRMKF